LVKSTSYGDSEETNGTMVTKPRRMTKLIAAATAPRFLLKRWIASLRSDARCSAAPAS
jgi:hypothetical protein